MTWISIELALMFLGFTISIDCGTKPETILANQNMDASERRPLCCGCLSDKLYLGISLQSPQGQLLYLQKMTEIEVGEDNILHLMDSRNYEELRGMYRGSELFASSVVT